MSSTEEIAALKAQIATLVEQVKAARIVKTKSDFFLNKSTSGPVAWRNLSETKKFMEKNAPEFLAQLVQENDGHRLNSYDFHHALLLKITE